MSKTKTKAESTMNVIVGVDNIVVGQDGTMTIPDQHYWDQAAANNLQEQQINDVHAFDVEYGYQLTLAVGKHAHGLFDVDPDMQSATYHTTLASGHATYDATVKRQQTYPGINGGEPVTKHGVVTVSTNHADYAAKLKEARRIIAETRAAFIAGQ